ncbi:hypothetical protein [Pseudomonas sp. AL15]|uniref:hypothetical protein n=1 Tax=Pseudomonas sp. AL15 TaxID=3042236 RepID=UPI00249A4894|nr:hypothetical protein [Pseudomonas sp. AL15]MDI3269026.1 hypothetical protein [Pseudomonas sp. AL15]
MPPSKIAPFEPSATALFNEVSQRTLVGQINHKAAIVGAIAAIASHAIETGDTDQALDDIADIAFPLRDEMRRLAVIAGQLQVLKNA